MPLAHTNPLLWATLFEDAVELCVFIEVLSFPCRRSFIHAAFSTLPDEVCGTSQVSQYSASFAPDVSDPVKATYPSGRTRTIEGEAPKYFSCPGMVAISTPRIR